MSDDFKIPKGLKPEHWQVEDELEYIRDLKELIKEVKSLPATNPDIYQHHLDNAVSEFTKRYGLDPDEYLTALLENIILSTTEE